MIRKAKKVYVGLSGGVDSSVSAALLQDAGHDVTGVFIRVWYPDFIECDWKQERRDAMRVCAHLNIPFKELDLADVYKQEVVDYMVREYEAGRTPNPDVMCNKHVKFGAFLEWALEEGADMVATGHYARTREVQMSKVKCQKLLAGADRQKDQSYFLWQLKQEQLRHIVFPVGELEKAEVREIAEEKGLLTADKKDSQGLCFLGHVDMKEFLKHFIEVEEGDVLDENGEVIGVHEGAQLFTIGERRGFTITKKGPSDPPYYVISKDVKSNTLTVSHARPGDRQVRNAQKVALEVVNWIARQPEDIHKYRARLRYRQDLQDVVVQKENDGWSVAFAAAQPGVAEGQSVVVYKGEECVGGGIISKLIE